MEINLDQNDIDVQQVQVDLNDLRYALEHEPEMWIQFHLAEELTYPVPAFHISEFKRMTMSTVSRLALAIPRGHAKTTLAKLAIVWFFTFSTSRFILYVSNTFPIAKAACIDILNYLKKENFTNVFGAPEFIKESETEGLWIFMLKKKDGSLVKCILRAMGAEQQIRGINIDNQRPEITVVDDLEDEENTGTDFLRAKLKKWVYGTFFKALSKKNKIIWLGNMLNNRCLLKEHCESEYWHSSRMGCLLADGTPLWPDLWPIEAIRLDFIEYQKIGMITTWFAEMMNMPLPEGMGLIRSEKIKYQPLALPEHIKYGYITIDPAISQKSWANKSALVAHGLVNGRWQVVDYEYGKFTTDILYDKMIGLALKWRFFVVGMEQSSFAASLDQLFKFYLMRDHHFKIQLVPLLTHHARKLDRIKAWCGLLESGDYVLTEGDYLITEQLLMYDPSKKENTDDLIDSCAYGVQMLESYMAQIMEEITGGDGREARGEYQTCGI